MKDLQVANGGAGQGPADNTFSVQIADLQRHEMQVQLRASDLQVRLAQLTRQQSVSPVQAERFDKPIADVQHDLTAARLDYDATHAKIASLQLTEQARTATTVQRPAAPPLIGQSQLEKAGTGLFLLLIPIAFALARRIWVRSSATQHPVYDLESSPRLQRLEEAVESIALEVERVGEAQRFATKLLSERRPDGAMDRPPAAAPASVRRVPGTITPH
ncbi:MAG: hypothetical protein ABJE47_16400 [bacterium]